MRMNGGRRQRYKSVNKHVMNTFQNGRATRKVILKLQYEQLHVGNTNKGILSAFLFCLISASVTYVMKMCVYVTLTGF